VPPLCPILLLRWGNAPRSGYAPPTWSLSLAETQVPLRVQWPPASLLIHELHVRQRIGISEMTRIHGYWSVQMVRRVGDAAWHRTPPRRIVRMLVKAARET
jgi:hypothetical protein